MFVTLAQVSIWSMTKLEQVASATRREIKRKTIEEEQIKLSLFTEYMIVYRKSKSFYGETVRISK